MDETENGREEVFSSLIGEKILKKES